MTDHATVTSIHGNRYRLVRELGRGGQGAVFAAEGERFAVKVLRDTGIRAREALRDQLAMVGRLPLEDLDVARPIEQLRPPHVGYVMELFTGMTPLSSLVRPPRKTKSVAQWYLSSGSLRRRLRVLARAAEVLAELHGRGLVYVDPSPSNVFVSEDVGGCEVRLVDTDNLRPGTTPGRTFFTPGYGAPELVKDTGAATSLSDVYAFAVMAFETLTLTHPFLGDLVQQGEPEIEEQALSGLLPWIGDPVDQSNYTEGGIPRDTILSDKLSELFGTTFEGGRTNPHLRPGMSTWAEYLHRAADRTISCPSCKGNYYHIRDACPWCSQRRPTFVLGRVLLFDPSLLQRDTSNQLVESPGIVQNDQGKPKIVDAVALTLGEETTITDRITHGSYRRTPRLRIVAEQNRIRVKALDGETWTLISPDGRRERGVASSLSDIAIGEHGARYLIHSGPGDRRHRVIHFDLKPGGSA